MRVAFMGSPEFAVPCLRALHAAHEVALVVSQPDKPAGRGGQVASPAVAVCARELGVSVIQPRSARNGELAAALAASGAELAIVVAYGKILPLAVLTAVPRGCVNVHASLLPKYRGAAPVQWSVIHGDAETGVAIMQLDEGMDTGPVYAERRVAIDPLETSGELLARLAPIGAETLLEQLAAIADGRAHAVAQDHAHATHAPMLTKADGAIDFRQPAEAVAARIRGVDPWPGAQATLRGQTIKLFRATTHPLARSSTGFVSVVFAIDDRGILVACGDGGTVIVRDIQAPGRKRMPAAQFAAGRGIAIGDQLGVPVFEPPPMKPSKPPAGTPPPGTPPSAS